MEIKILSRCDADEAQHIATNSITRLDELDLSTNPYLTEVKSKLVAETKILSGALSVERKHEYTNELANLDLNFDNRVICLRKFIEANTYSSDETIAKNAEKALDKLESYDSTFYKLGYEKEIARAFSLVEEYEKPDMKPVVESLVGVTTPIMELKTVTNQLNTLYLKNQDIQALKEDTIPSTIQKKVVIDIFNNELLPYLMVMKRVQPDTFGETYTKITHYIETINTKIRTRRNRPASEEEENSEAE
ncbi:DUF6261 family protein [Marinifilum flexuosum]|uniref:DUF6261 family protein n=1 Tax=Marinifilum flexuosum TaxID=1117708 RepID=UPI0024957128|nr:DUF6261 family protein [Marinifilum flexuosum]